MESVLNQPLGTNLVPTVRCISCLERPGSVCEHCRDRFCAECMEDHAFYCPEAK